MIVPVSADSRRLGVLVLGAGRRARRPDQPRRAGEAAQTLTPADVDLLWTLGRQAGQALERARLHEETARQAERAAFLLEAARLLAGGRGRAPRPWSGWPSWRSSRLADLCVIDLATDRG